MTDTPAANIHRVNQWIHVIPQSPRLKSCKHWRNLCWQGSGLKHMDNNKHSYATSQYDITSPSANRIIKHFIHHTQKSKKLKFKHPSSILSSHPTHLFLASSLWKPSNETTYHSVPRHRSKRRQWCDCWSSPGHSFGPTCNVPAMMHHVITFLTSVMLIATRYQTKGKQPRTKQGYYVFYAIRIIFGRFHPYTKWNLEWSVALGPCWWSQINPVNPKSRWGFFGNEMVE